MTSVCARQDRPGDVFPDLVLTAGKKLAGLVEVETGESVNNLEAMAQWVHFSRARVPFHLYVPVPAYDAARRLCDANGAPAEIWTYRSLATGSISVRGFHDPSAASVAPAAARPPKDRRQERPSRPQSRARTARAKPAQSAVQAAAKASATKPAKPAKARKAKEEPQR